MENRELLVDGRQEAGREEGRDDAVRDDEAWQEEGRQDAGLEEGRQDDGREEGREFCGVLEDLLSWEEDGRKAFCVPFLPCRL